MNKWVRAVRIGVFAAAGVWGSSAHAETVVATTPSVVATTPSTDAPRSYGPNTALITSGFITFGVPYVTSVIVAAQSQHDGDKNLYIPVAGPWVDLGNRGSCDGPNQPTCATETGYKVLLVADGILQTVGAVEMVAGLLIPQRQATVVAEKPSVHLAPAPVAGGGLALAAIGRF